MKLHRLRIVNFAAIENVDVEFGPGLNVLYGPEGLDQQRDSRYGASYFHLDVLGSPRALTNNTGAAIAACEYPNEYFRFSQRAWAPDATVGGLGACRKHEHRGSTPPTGSRTSYLQTVAFAVSGPHTTVVHVVQTAGPRTRASRIRSSTASSCTASPTCCMAWPSSRSQGVSTAVPVNARPTAGAAAR